MVAKCKSFIIGDSGISRILFFLPVRVHPDLCTASQEIQGRLITGLLWEADYSL